MEYQSEFKPPVKRRRRHSPQFKTQVLEEAQQPGVSLATVAQRHNLNANLIHKWRRTAERELSCAPTIPAFIPLPTAPALRRSSEPEVRVEVSGSRGTINLFWPCDQALSLAEFLKTFS